MEVPTGLEPMVEELQSSALPTWLWNRRNRDCLYTILCILK
jgi:hypothetical protein